MNLKNLVGKQFKTKNLIRPKTKKIIEYSEKYNGYIIESNRKNIAITMASPEDYFRFLAGERKHLYKDYDPEKHYMYYSHYNSEEYVTNGCIPIYVAEFKTSTKTIDIPYGTYRAVSVGGNCVLRETEISCDEYIDFYDKKWNLHYELKKFKKDRQKYLDQNVRHKFGVLLYGPRGTGKSSQINKILRNATKDEIIAIYISSNFSQISDLEVFKEPLKGKTVVFVLEEFTERMTTRSNTEEILSFLDSGTSWDNAFIIATTNYAEKLPKNIIERPGRFSLILKVDYPSQKEIIRFLQCKGYDEKTAKKAAEQADKLPIDYIAQSVIQSKVRDMDLVDYLKFLKKTQDKLKGDFQGSSMGFHADPDDDKLSTFDIDDFLPSELDEDLNEF